MSKNGWLFICFSSPVVFLSFSPLHLSLSILLLVALIPERMRWLTQEKFSMIMEVEELETLLGSDDIDVDFRRILEEARDDKGCAIFETFSTDVPSKFVVVSRSK